MNMSSLLGIAMEWMNKLIFKPFKRQSSNGIIMSDSLYTSNFIKELTQL